MGRRLLAWCSLALMGAAPPAENIVATPFDAAPVADRDLARMRGGFALPGGLDVAITVRSITSVEGRPLLTTVFAADRGAPSVSAFAGGESAPITLSRGESVAVSGGTLSLWEGGGSQIVFRGSDLEVRHLAGQAYGSVVANSANDVSIDTATAVDLQIRNATALNIGSAMLRIDSIATEAAARTVR